MYVQAHELFKRFMAGMEARPEASVVHSLAEPPKLGDFLQALDPELSLNWSSQDFRGLPRLREKMILRTGTNTQCSIADVLVDRADCERAINSFNALMSGKKAD